VAANPSIYALRLAYRMIMDINGLPLVAGDFITNTMSQWFQRQRPQWGQHHPAMGKVLCDRQIGEIRGPAHPGISFPGKSRNPENCNQKNANNGQRINAKQPTNGKSRGQKPSAGKPLVSRRSSDPINT
jgi:hypothetical protein